MRLSGKVAMVTGGTAGIGANIVETMAAQGASVGFTGRSADRGKKLEADLSRQGARRPLYSGRQGIEADVDRAVRQTVDAFGSLTILVNNAAATEMSASGADNHVDEITNESWDISSSRPCMELCGRASTRFLTCARQVQGSIVNISASSSMRSSRGRPAYQSSKGAINSLPVRWLPTTGQNASYQRDHRWIHQQCRPSDAEAAGRRRVHVGDQGHAGAAVHR